MSAVAPTLEAFFTQRLINQRQASPHTVAAYRDTFRLLLGFAHQHCGRAPATLDFDDLDASLIGAFLDHLERERGNSTRSRNARLAAIHSLFRFAALRHPDHAALIARVLAIPTKRFDRSGVSFLTREEVDALLAVPDRTRWIGRRDHALLAVATQTGLRVSELIGLRRQDVQLTTGAHVRCRGKGRKDRCTPLTTATVKVLRVWLKELHGSANTPLFPGPRGAPLSGDAVRRLVAKHAAAASQQCPSIAGKHVTPHVLRHTAAMQLLQAGIDSTVVALWLGHQTVRSTEPYVHADLALKERALARTTPAAATPGRYRPPDALIAFLEAL